MYNKFIIHIFPFLVKQGRRDILPVFLNDSN